METIMEAKAKLEKHVALLLENLDGCTSRPTNTPKKY